MSPSSFFIEVPERPSYVPGSGPPLRPITITPDNTETGWVLVDLVDLSGVQTYIVTPKDDPVHRKAVKLNHILDWVSPKAYEDFEYARYKNEVQLEEERLAKKLARSAALKEKTAKRHAEAARAHLLGQQYRRLQGRTNGYNSSTGAESDVPSGRSSVARTVPTKRRFPDSEGNIRVKRRAVEAAAAKIAHQLKAEEEEAPPLLATRMNDLMRSFPPILPPMRKIPGPPLNSTSEPDEYLAEDKADEWEINGILSSSRRPHPTTGKIVRQYLIDWAGDYEPSWEPEENVGDDAIKTFEVEQDLKKKEALAKLKAKGRERSANGFGSEGTTDHPDHEGSQSTANPLNKKKGAHSKDQLGLGALEREAWYKRRRDHNTGNRTEKTRSKGSAKAPDTDAEAHEEAEVEAQLQTENAQRSHPDEDVSTEGCTEDEDGTSFFISAPSPLPHASKPGSSRATKMSEVSETQYSSTNPDSESER